MAVYEFSQNLRGARRPNGISDVDRKKIRARNKAVHRFSPDMIGIHVPGSFPTELCHRVLCRGSNFGRFRTDDQMLAVGFVPHRDDLDSERLGQDTAAQLGFRFPAESVAHPQRIFSER